LEDLSEKAVPSLFIKSQSYVLMKLANYKERAQS